MTLRWSKFTTALTVFSLLIGILAAFLYIMRTPTSTGLSTETGTSKRRRAAVSQDGFIPVKLGAVLANDDVVELSRAGLAPATIVKMIERTPCRFDTAAPEILRMKRSGVPNEVVAAMVTVLDGCYTPPAKSAPLKPFRRNSVAVDPKLVTD